MKSSVTRRKTETKILTGFRLHPELKSLATEAAIQENRSFSNYLENLIRMDLESRGILESRKNRK